MTMSWTRSLSFYASLFALLGVIEGPKLASQCVNVSTGFDQVAGAPIEPLMPDDDYTVDGGAGPQPAFTVEDDGFPIPPWIANDDSSRWIGFNTPDSAADAGTYFYEIHFTMPPAIDASKAVLIGKWATDDPGQDVFINDTSTGFTAGGFSAYTPFPPNAGLGLFLAGDNVIRFQVLNGSGPTGLRVDGCVGVPVAVTRQFDISTGFDQKNKLLLGDNTADDDYKVTGPPGSGIGPLAATAVADDDFPIPPWFANGVNSRWVGLGAADSKGPAGAYTYEVNVFLPTSIDAKDAVLCGTFSAAGALDDVLVNGNSAGIKALDPATLSSFSVDAGLGLFKSFSNSIQFLVRNDSEGPTGLRVDGEIIQITPPPVAPPSVLTLDTGFDNAGGTTIADALPDDNYVVLGPPGSTLRPAFATVVMDDGYPIPPWIPNSSFSKWIGLDAPDSGGPAGVYTYKIKVSIPDAFDAAQARLVGGWATDDNGQDVIINGTAMGFTAGGFGGLTQFAPDAGLGLFHGGENEVDFILLNGGGPTGLRVEAVAGFEDPRPGDLSTGIGVRGIGPFPGGFPDDRYVVTGPDGAGIGPRPAVVVPQDGSPIPPWLSNSNASQWVGLDGNDSIGPPGAYRYAVSFILGSVLNPAKVALAGSWAASSSGVDVTLNGTSLKLTAAGPGSLTPFPPNTGLGLMVTGANTLELIVNNAAQGSTGLRVEAKFQTAPGRDPLDISTGYNQETGQAFLEGESDDDYTVTDPGLVTDAAIVALGAPIPPWIQNTETSKWISAAASDPGQYIYEIFVNLETDADAAEAFLVGLWAVDDQGADVLINGTSAGLQNTGGFGGYTPFPPDAGKGLFQKGQNSIQFLVINGGAAPNPTGLRVDAAVKIARKAGPLFHRGDADNNGVLQLTDAVRILNFLFLGTGKIDCKDAADADNNGKLQLTDAVRVLNVLFLGQGSIPDPGPPFAGVACGPDPGAEADHLGCDSYPPCGG